MELYIHDLEEALGGEYSRIYASFACRGSCGEYGIGRTLKAVEKMWKECPRQASIGYKWVWQNACNRQLTYTETLRMILEIPQESDFGFEG